MPTAAELDSAIALLVAARLKAEEVERRLTVAVLADCRGDKPEVARRLGVSLKTVYNRLARYDSAETARP